MMPGMNRKERKRLAKEKSSKSQAGDALGPSDSASTFSGPIMPIERVRGTDKFVRLLCDYAAISTNGSGVYAVAFSSDPTSMTQWANMIGNVDQYRVLAIELVFEPQNRYNQTLSVAYAGAIPVIMTVLDYNSAVALSSYQVAAEFASCRMKSLADAWERSIRATGLDLMAWVDTNNAPTRVMSIKTYVTGANASTTVGHAIVRRLIQFRSTV